MTILAVVAYTGSEKLVRMTEEMLESLLPLLNGEEPVRVVAVNNAAVRPIKHGLVLWHPTMEKNEGFGPAINFAIQTEIFDAPKLVNMDTGEKIEREPTEFTDVLVLNNDLQFPDRNWLQELLKARDGQHVLSPCTDITATKAAVTAGAEDRDPVPHHEVSAFCWLVPVTLVRALRKKFGFNLFHPDFPNYGSDDVTSACLRSIVGKQPFKIVPRSWVRHLKARTANELGLKGGDRALIGRIVNFKRSKRLL